MPVTTKRLLKVVGICAGILVAMFVTIGVILLGPFFVERKAIEDGFEINGIRIVRDGIGSMAVIPISKDEMALIDAGNDTAGRAILAELARRRLSPDAVAAVFITHGYPDHIGAAHLFPRARIMSLESEVPLIEGRAGARGPMSGLMPVSPTGIKVTSPLHDGDTVSLAQTDIRVFAVPGHMAGHAAQVLLPADLLRSLHLQRPHHS
jgi:glyoxylase-like metal-dependent hydrolase (beta-lactamase superfamily II)